MKFIFSFLIGLFGFSNLFAQELIVDSGVVLKKGVYRNFDEFKYNSPSLDYFSEIDTLSMKSGVIGNREEIIYYDIGEYVDSGLKSNQMFGFCDGESVFFNVDYSKFSKKNFIKVEYIGRYCYYKHSTPNTSAVVAGGIAGGLVGGLIVASVGQPVVQYVLNINNGESFAISKSILKSIFTKNDSLLKDIKDLEGSNPDLKNLLIKYSKLHEYQIERKLYIDNRIYDELIHRKTSDSSLLDYETRIQSYQSDPMFYEIKILKSYYGNDQMKIFGIWAKHEEGNNKDYPYDIGTWYYFHKNGQIKEEVNYNLLGKKNGRNIEYNDSGKVIKESMYSNGELVKE